jgi:molecular chaperone DnaK
MEKMLREHRDKVSEADAKALETAIEDVKNAMKEDSLEGLNAAMDRLNQASHKLAEAMYKASAGSQQPGGGAGPTPGGDGPGPSGGGKEGDNVVDAEFVDVDDKK